MSKEIQGSFDGDGVGLDLEQLQSRLDSLVDAARRLDVALSESVDQLPDLGSNDVRMNTDTADPAELEERQDEVVVSGVEVEVGLPDDPPRLGEIAIRLLDSPDVGDVGELDDGVGLDVDDDPPGDVVDDDGPVGDSAIARKCSTIPRAGGLL